MSGIITVKYVSMYSRPLLFASPVINPVTVSICSNPSVNSIFGQQVAHYEWVDLFTKSWVCVVALILSRCQDTILSLWSCDFKSNLVHFIGHRTSSPSIISSSLQIIRVNLLGHHTSSPSRWNPRHDIAVPNQVGTYFLGHWTSPPLVFSL